MMHQAPQPKTTPNRRRPQAGRSRTTPQKTYASENDIPTYKPGHAVGPSTPQKAISGGASSVRATSTTQKQRSKGTKNRNKNGAVSPGHRKQDRESPSFLSSEATAPIFAGSTFHASPAPSALPIPSFLSRSVSDSPAIRVNPSPAQEPSPPTTESDEASIHSDPPVLRDEESPLEFFFRADRAEKEKARRASAINAIAAPLGPFSPPHEPSARECQTLPRAAAVNHPRRPNCTQRNSNTRISTAELDGTPSQPVGPAFSTPYNERIKAVRLNHNSAQATPVTAQSQELDPTEALKRYLFGGQLNSTAQEQAAPQQQQQPRQSRSRRQAPQQQPIHHVSQPHYRHESPQQSFRGQISQPVPQHQSPQPRLPPGMFPASVLTPHAGAQPPTPPAQSNHDEDPQSENTCKMEDMLRRVLKLDPAA